MDLQTTPFIDLGFFDKVYIGVRKGEDAGEAFFDQAVDGITDSVSWDDVFFDQVATEFIVVAVQVREVELMSGCCFVVNQPSPIECPPQGIVLVIIVAAHDPFVEANKVVS